MGDERVHWTWKLLPQGLPMNVGSPHYAACTPPAEYVAVSPRDAMPWAANTVAKARERYEHDA